MKQFTYFVSYVVYFLPEANLLPTFSNAVITLNKQITNMDEIKLIEEEIASKDERTKGIIVLYYKLLSKK